MIPLPESDAELLAQCDVDTFRAGGKGGQHQNTTDSGVRLTHRPSGVVVTCRSRRSQHQNKQQCLTNLRGRIEELNHVPVERVPTKVPYAVKKRVAKEKTKQAEKKRLRRTPASED